MPSDLESYQARELLDLSSLTSADKTRLSENLAHYNHQMDPPVTHPWDLMDTTNPRTRWHRKLQRDLSSPYTDSEAIQKLAQLEAELVTLLQAQNPFPSRLFVTGGITRGRFGANSDLDLVGQDLLADETCRRLAGYPGWSAARVIGPDGSTVKQSVSSPSGMHADFLVEPHFRRLTEWYGSAVALDEPRLAPILTRALEAKGYQVHGERLSASGSIERPTEPTLDYPLDFGTGYQIVEY
ncbi:MAG: hypothetical protein KC910_00700 [Candidatus Eremiobacteraeota bacterium]|nr:hypothetical protein [Candidatus Eremiobacteraeota bacterium]